MPSEGQSRPKKENEEELDPCKKYILTPWLCVKIYTPINIYIYIYMDVYVHASCSTCVHAFAAYFTCIHYMYVHTICIMYLLTILDQVCTPTTATSEALCVLSLPNLIHPNPPSLGTSFYDALEPFLNFNSMSVF